jgi:DNA-binding HxlR family transcriptional regulator
LTSTALPPVHDADLARVTEALHMITPRWNVRILLALNEGPQRYTGIAAKFPYLQSGQLHPKISTLCTAGLVQRTEHSARHVTYGLTGRGQQLLPVFSALATWAREHLEQPDQPLSAIEQVEDSLTLLARRQAPAILWALKLRGEAGARLLGHIVIPACNWTSVYPPLRQLVDDGLVADAGNGQPYHLTAAGEGLAPVFGALSMWAAGRPVDHAVRHPLWGQTESGHDDMTVAHSWVSYQSHQSRLPAPPARPGPPAPAVPTRPAARRSPVWQHHELFSHTAPGSSTLAPQMAGAGR